MAQRPAIKIRHSPVRTSPTAQLTFTGASAIPGERGRWPQAPILNGDTSLSKQSVRAFGPWIVAVGNFTSMGGQPRSGFGAFDRTTGVVSDIWAQSWGNGPLVPGPSYLETDGVYLYAAGFFSLVEWNDRTTGVPGGIPTTTTTIAGRPIGGLVRFDVNGNLDLTWNPNPVFTLGQQAYTVLKYNPATTTLYVGGPFLISLDGTLRNLFGEVATTGFGAATAWDLNPDGGVATVEIDADRSQVYLGGSFTTVNSPLTVRNRIARFSYAGVVDATFNALVIGSTVLAILVDDQVIWIGGLFTSLGGTATTNVGGVRQPTAVFTGNISNANLSVSSIKKVNPNVAIICGQFTSISLGGVVARNRLAAFQIRPGTTNGNAQSWNPNPNSGVSGIHIVDDTTYLSGASSTTDYTPGKAFLQAIPYPFFTDTNSSFFALSGSDTNPGTLASPYRTIGKAVGDLGAGAVHSYAVGLDSGDYDEQVVIDYRAPDDGGGLFAAYGQTPRLIKIPGAVEGTFGARPTGRTKFSTGLSSTYLYVNQKYGDNASAVRGDPNRPFISVLGAMSSGARLANDTVVIQDSEKYSTASAFAVATGNAVTIQAAAGQVPTLEYTGAGPMFSGWTARVSLYGLQLTGTNQGGPGSVFSGSFDLEMYDCSISFFGQQNQANGTTGVRTIQNCLFYWTTGFFVQSGTFTARNCKYVSCQMPSSGENQYNPSIAGAVAIVEDHCTHLDSMGATCVDITPTFNATGSITVSNCLFSKEKQVAFTPNGVLISGANTPALVITARDNWFDGLSNAGIRDQVSVGSTGSRNYIQNRFTSCVTGLLCSGRSENLFIVDNIAIRCSTYGFFVVTAGNMIFILNINNCVSVNAGQVGFRVANTNNSGTRINRCAEAGSGVNGGDATTSNNSIACTDVFFQKSQVGPFTGQTTADPMFVSIVPGSENIAFQALSPAVANLGRDMVGPRLYLCNLAVAHLSATIDGMSFAGESNWYSGFQVSTTAIIAPAGQQRGLIMSIRYCTMSGLGDEGGIVGSISSVDRCLFSPINGRGLTIQDTDSEVTRSAFSNCAVTAILSLYGGISISHVSAFACAYGHRDKSGLPLILEGNILSGNSTFDYSGGGSQNHSDIGTIEGGGGVANGTRLDPLFRDVDAPDLRLQTIETGQFYNSPAKGLAADGTDAGAYLFFYGPISTAWSIIDFGINPTVTTTAYRGPMHYTRRVVPYKPSEGDTHGGLFYSTASAFKKEHILEWEQNAMMPVAQVNDLIALFIAGSGEVQLSLDGGATWIPCRVVRSSEFQYTEIEGSFYGSDTLPTPVTRLVLRESA